MVIDECVITEMIPLEDRLSKGSPVGVLSTLHMLNFSKILKIHFDIGLTT